MPTQIEQLESVLRERRTRMPAGSYSAELFADRELVQRKVMEEAFEVCLELGRADIDRTRVIDEAADLVFHLVVGLVGVGLSFDDVLTELERRRR